MAQQMDKENLANVSLIERPVASPLPVWPNARLDLAIGALLGIFVGFASALVWPQGPRGVPVGARRFTPEFSREKMPSPVAGD